MNKARKKILASIFADAAKFSLTGGILGGVIAGKISLINVAILLILFIIFILLAYFLTPKQNNNNNV